MDDCYLLKIARFVNGWLLSTEVKIAWFLYGWLLLTEAALCMDIYASLLTIAVCLYGRMLSTEDMDSYYLVEIAWEKVLSTHKSYI